MKNGVPAADAAGLSREWISSVDSNALLGMDPGIAAIEAANLANIRDPTMDGVKLESANFKF